jgi:peptidoglycan/LPS O-acetylase OafA/YrhL
MTSVIPQSGRVRDPAKGRTASPPTGAKEKRFSPLDGIRAFAILAVLLYHFGVPWTGGGLLGVDVFFVLSGFLITTLICREVTETGGLRLGRFWAQRARRLLPALFVLLLGVAAYAYFSASSVSVTSIRGDAIATLLYVANWHFILSDQGYFAQAASPSPFLHTWSLAVEEQFYLVWPLVALAVARWWGITKLAVVAGVGAVASATLMVSLYAAGFSVDRIYYGTDTRAQALLVGSFLGAVGSHAGKTFTVLPTRWTSDPMRRRWWTVPGICGGIFLIWAWHELAGQDPFLYHGGFFLVALAAGAVIVTCVTVPNSLIPRLCSLRVLVFVGRISYGLYIYHWLLFLVINHAHTGLTGTPLLLARLGATFAVSTVSFFLLEEPIRRGSFFRGLKGLLSVGAISVATVGAVVLATVAPATVALAAPTHGQMPAAERHSLSGVGAFTTDPITFAMLGDSVGLTLGVGLTVNSVHDYGVRLINGGVLGCDLDNVEVRLSGQVQRPTRTFCTQWRTSWKNGIDHFRPDVVGILLGRWEVSDHLFDGQWVHVGEPAWDNHLESELNEAVDISSSDGAKVVLFTMPYIDPPTEAANGSPFPENDPSRVTAFNRLLEHVAAQRSSVVTLIDLNAMLDPAGRYQPVVGGITVRWTDGVHITKAGGEWLQPVILPQVANLGLAARRP